MANGINWAWQNNAQIINNSWGDQGGAAYNILHSAILEQSINDAITLGRNGLGCIVVFSSGNHTVIDYPVYTNSEIICVGGINESGLRFSNGDVSFFSGYGSELDIVAPGEQIVSTAAGNEIDGGIIGTSVAAPVVSGIAALILSVNPCLSQKQVRDIIEKISQKVGGYSYINTAGRPNGTWNNQMGYGLVDAFAATQMAQQMYSATLDLMVKDGTDDIGNEPYNITPYMWTSSDIWIRNQPDGIDEHQNPEYNPTVPNYAYVRITNKSCVASSGNEQLKFYWAKAGTSLSWPNTWDGTSTFVNGALQGAPSSPNPSTIIPVLQPGQEIVLQIPFLVPNPYNYNFQSAQDQWHLCLLARIEAINDPSNENSGLYANVQNNNNIGWKNVTIVDLIANKTSGTIAVGNPYNEPHTFF